MKEMSIVIITTLYLNRPISIYYKSALHSKPQYRALSNKPHKLCSYSPEPCTEVCCVRLNFNISKLVNFYKGRACPCELRKYPSVDSLLHSYHLSARINNINHTGCWKNIRRIVYHEPQVSDLWILWVLFQNPAWFAMPLNHRNLWSIAFI